MNTKKLVDDAATCIDDVVVGLLYANPALARLQGMNVVLRKDIADSRERQVSILSGGGSGHEPAHAGYIGEGMLSGAVLGNVFASPSTTSILSAIKIAAGPKGVLLIVKNYTGDRLNFGIALEQARGLGIAVRMVVVADDVALPPGQGITGGRGIAGTVLVHKVAGAAASRGGSLDEVVAAAERAADAMGSLGVALTTCTLPGTTSSSHRLSEPYSCEVGMGIHGEPGREHRLLPKTGAATELAELLVGALLDRLPPAEGGAGMAVLINNLGALPAMEVATMTKSIVGALLNKGQRLVRLYSGPFMTALDMAGLSLTLLRVDGLLDLLDHPTSAPAWQVSAAAADTDLPARTIAVSSVPSMAPRCKLVLPVESLALGERVCRALTAAEPQLTHYDSICGDGDCGLVMCKGAARVAGCLPALQGQNAVVVCSAIADAIAEAMGGTSGVLLEVFFRTMASALVDEAKDAVDAREVKAEELARAFHSGVLAIQRYGGAERGMRTMLDALLPAADALLQGGGAREAADAAAAGAEATKQMHSVAGRSNYVVFERLAGIPDPGAVAVAVALGAIADRA